MLEKEKNLITSIFSFSNNISTLSQTSPGFYLSELKLKAKLEVLEVLKTLRGKKKLLETVISSFFHSLFYPFEERSTIFIKLSAENSFSLEKSKICVFEKGF